MKTFGLLGGEIAYSLSEIIHNFIFEKNNFAGEYKLYPTTKENLEEFLNMAKARLEGFNVTIPYKQDIIKYLDFISEEAKEIGAVNTVKIIDNKLYGYNTDYYGFGAQLNSASIKIEGKEFYILGNGGAEKAVRKYLKDNKAFKVTTISRSPSPSQTKGYDFLETIDKGYCLINTTPLGTFPNISESPVDLEIVKKFDCIVDLVYNPIETTLIKLGRAKNKIAVGGLVMLLNQGIESQRIWNSIELSSEDENKLYNLLKESIEG